MQDSFVFDNISEADIVNIKVIPIWEAPDGYTIENIGMEPRFYLTNNDKVQIYNNTEGLLVLNGSYSNAVLGLNGFLSTHSQSTIQQISSMELAKKHYLAHISFTYDSSLCHFFNGRIIGVKYRYNFTPPGCGSINNYTSVTGSLGGARPIKVLEQSDSSITWSIADYNQITRYTYYLDGDPPTCTVHTTNITPLPSYTTSFSSLDGIYVIGTALKQITPTSYQSLPFNTYYLPISDLVSITDTRFGGYRIGTSSRYAYELSMQQLTDSQGDWYKIRISSNSSYLWQLTPTHNYTFTRGLSEGYSGPTYRYGLSSDTSLKYSWLKLENNKFKCVIERPQAWVVGQCTVPIAIDYPIYNYTFTAGNSYPYYNESLYSVQSRNLYKPADVNIKLKYQFWGLPNRCAYVDYNKFKK